MDAMTDYYYAKEREESAVLRINDLYLEALNALEKLEAENAKLRDACAELLKMAESSDPEWLHWPEMHDELRELGVKYSDNG